MAANLLKITENHGISKQNEWLNLRSIYHRTTVTIPIYGSA